MTQVHNFNDAVQFIENLLDEKDDEINTPRDQVAALEWEVFDLEV